MDQNSYTKTIMIVIVIICAMILFAMIWIMLYRKHMNDKYKKLYCQTGITSLSGGITSRYIINESFEESFETSDTASEEIFDKLPEEIYGKSLGDSSNDVSGDVLENSSGQLTGGAKRFKRKSPKRLQLVVKNITQKDWMKIDLSKYVLLDKFDGVQHKYENDGLVFLYEEVKPLNVENTVAFIFDVLMVDGKDVTNKPFAERMNIKPPQGYFLKEPKEMKDKQEILNYVFDNATDTVMVNEFEIPVDGVILQGDLESYKIKKPFMNTIDFKMDYREGKFELFTIRQNKHISKHTRGGTNEPVSEPIYERFKCPYFDNPFCYVNDPLELDAEMMLSPRIKEELIKGHEYLKANAEKLTGLIGEFCNINKKWHFMRLKDHANSSPNAVIISALIFNQLHTKEGYFNVVKNDPITNMFHNMSHAVRAKMFETIIGLEQKRKEKIQSESNSLAIPMDNNKKNLVVLDIACGRGGDIKYIRGLGASKIIGIDSDRDALSTYGLKAPFCSVLHNANINKATARDVARTLSKRYRFERADIVIINFAIHYFLDCLPELSAMIRELVNPGARCYITYFDADAIITDAGKKNAKKESKNEPKKESTISINDLGNKSINVQIGPLSISLENNQLKMPLPTISSSGHTIEDIVHKDDLSVLGSNLETYQLKIYKKDSEGFTDICAYTKYMKLAALDINWT